MMARRIALLLAVSLWLSGQVFAEILPKISLDPWGNINVFKLEENVLKFESPFLAQTQDLYTFTLEATSFDLKSENSRFYLIYSLKSATREAGVYFTYSRDNGQSFSRAQLIAQDGQNPALAITNNLILAAWEEQGVVKLAKSEAGGYFFSQPEIISITGESLVSPDLLIDPTGKIHLAYVSLDPNTGLSKVIYNRFSPQPFGHELVSTEAATLVSSYDNLTNLNLTALPNQNDRIIISWQEEYLGRRRSFFAVSLDGGSHFSQARSIEFEDPLLGLGIIKDKFSAITYTDQPVVTEIELPPIFAPEIVEPTDGAAVTLANLKITALASAKPPLLCIADISQDDFFPSGNTRSLSVVATQETAVFDLPSDIPDGKYHIRLRADDGIKTSPASQTLSFTIDNVSPEVISLEAERVGNEIIFSGKVSEQLISLTINNIPRTLEADLSFETQLPIKAGNNIFTLILSDEAGNLLTSTEEYYYDPALPEITIIAPVETDWFKPGSAIMIEAEVFDLQGDLAEESEAQLIIDGIPLADSLIYDQEESILSGFILLPDNLADGKHAGKIILSDITGNMGEAVFTLNIDGSAPQVSTNKCYTNSQTSIAIPLIDQGAGIDASGTLIKIAGITFEGTATVEGNDLVVDCNSLLLEGTYEVSVTPRDLVGNISEPTSFSLIVDTTPPQLTLDKTAAQTNKAVLLISGKIEEENIAEVTIHNNQNTVKSFSPNSNSFSTEINLTQGTNNILVEVTDQAGNACSENIRITATHQSSASILTSFMHGPNPFSPATSLPGAFSTQGKGMVFAYTLAKPADLMIRIYDITGTLIWVKAIPNTSSGVTAWDGVNQFGQMSSNGIYPYFFSAAKDGLVETRKGKIIISQ